MAFSIPPRPLRSQFTTLLHSFAQGDGLPFASGLTEEQIARVAREERVHFGTGVGCIFTVPITLLAFVGQYLAGQCNCLAAVARVIVLRAALGLEACAAGTGAYCKARAKLPDNILRRLTSEVGNGVEDQAPSSWRWHNRRTLLVDGFETIFDDTQANQTEYPQPRTQRPGVGYPMMRVVVLLTFATAMLLDAAAGPYAGKVTGENALFRQLLVALRADDLVVADRYCCSYFMIALLQQRGVDAAFRLNQRRKHDFRHGRRLGHDDHVVVWHCPQRPAWMTPEDYATMPKSLTIREVRFTTDVPGSRGDSIVVATNLLDHAAIARPTSRIFTTNVGTPNWIPAPSNKRCTWI